MSFLYWLLVVLFISTCVLLILLVLIQKGRGGGLSSAFGGMGGNTAFGSKTGDVLTWATSILFGVFILLAIGLNLLANKRHEDSKAVASGIVQQTPPAPANPVPTVPPAPLEPGIVPQGAPDAPAQK